MKHHTIRLLHLAFALFFLTAILPSCTKESAPDSFTQTSYKQRFEKQVVLIDQSGNNSVTLLIYAPDQSVVNNFSAASFELNVLTDAPTEETPAVAENNSITQGNADMGIHIEIVSQQLAPGVKGVSIETHLDEGTFIERAWAVNIWFHNNFNTGTKNRKTKVSASASFYVDGVYTGFWPYWQKRYGNFWTTAHTTPVYLTNNLSVNITQTNASTISYTYWAW